MLLNYLPILIFLVVAAVLAVVLLVLGTGLDRKSTRLNSSHPSISTLFPYTTLFRSRLRHRNFRQGRVPIRRPRCYNDAPCRGAGRVRSAFFTTSLCC